MCVHVCVFDGNFCVGPCSIGIFLISNITIYLLNHSCHTCIFVMMTMVIMTKTMIAQHEKKVSDQASVCTQTEDRELIYQKSIAGWLVCKLSGVQSSRQECSS